MVSDSVDNFWLVKAMRYGLPDFLFLALALGTVIWSMCRRRIVEQADRMARKAWMATACGLLLAGCTVHFWNAIFCLFFFFLGAGTWLMGRTSIAPQAAPRVAYA